MLETRTLESLEWSLIQDALAIRSRSPLGMTLARKHIPLTLSAAERLRQRVLEARVLVEQSTLHSLVSGAIDVREQLDRAAREGVLEPAQIYACGHFLRIVGLTGEELRARSEQAPRWASDFALAPTTPPLCDRIDRSVSGEGVILDSASSELARLRRARAAKRLDFEAGLSSKIKDWYSKGLLQDNFYDQIDGRYVVPVKAGEQSKMDGTLVSRSNTGQSVFIEPAELRAANNELKEVDLAIKVEEYRILRALSGELGALAEVYAPWVEVVAELDLACAAAVLARDWDLAAPKPPEATTSELRLDDVFHPGLKLRDVDIVKNSFAMAADGHGMLISGPNTGGKTVLLKAAAITACMSRAGLLVPAKEGSLIPHYAEVFAFIGDDQNIAAGLSSFSAQITDLQAVLKDTRAPLLIVVDEILSSTDPEEASALAQSVIEELVSRGHHVLVTSHFSELSLRLKTNPSMTVAAMEFGSGKPSYRLHLDELGSSHALDVAERLGLPARLLKRARELVSTAKLDYEKARDQLRTRERELELEHARALAALERDKEGYRLELREELQQKIHAFMNKTNATVSETVQALTQRISAYTRQGIGGNSGAKKGIARIEATAKELMRSLGDASSTVRRELEGGTPEVTATLPLEIGALVRIRSMKGSRGTILDLRGTGATQIATIQVGNFRLEKPAEELEVIPRPPEKLATRYYVGIDSAVGTVPRKLDVRGRRFDEALSECERYIDQAFRSGAAQVTVVTGHGTGALKKGLKELLSRLPYIREFRPEREGDDGATLIEFDR